MLKKRIAIALHFNDGVLYRTKRFEPDYRYTTSFLSVDSIDEVICIDITRSGPSEASRLAIAEYAKECYCPMSIGGSVDSLEDARICIVNNADKVILGASALKNPGLIGEISKKMGCQAVTVSVDCIGNDVFYGKTMKPASMKAGEWAKIAENEGAGEIFFNDIERDGSLTGYNLKTLEEIVSSVKIPVTVAGGCGGWRHMEAAFASGADCCVTTVIHHFTETSISGFKSALIDRGVPLRPVE